MSDLKHRDFIADYQNNRINVNVDAKTGLELVNEHLPARYRITIHLWSWLWILTLFGGAFAAFWYKLWVGLVLVFVVTPMLKIGVKQAACRFLVTYALKNEEFYRISLKTGALVIQKR